MIGHVTVRRAQPADYPRITALLTEARLPLDGLTGPRDFLVLCRDGRVLGCAAIERYGKHGLLRSVALDRHERGHGLGSRLGQAALRRARRGGLAEVVLLTTTAAPFFRRLGFHAITREYVPLSLRASVEFQTACPASASVLRLVF